jgi:hypothetical protein
MASDPLRREAEESWAESEQIAVKRQRRGQAKTRARAKRRQSTKEQQDQIARLTDKLKQAERKLVQHRRRKAQSRDKQ